MDWNDCPRGMPLGGQIDWLRRYSPKLEKDVTDLMNKLKPENWITKHWRRMHKMRTDLKGRKIHVIPETRCKNLVEALPWRWTRMGKTLDRMSRTGVGTLENALQHQRHLTCYHVNTLNKALYSKPVLCSDWGRETPWFTKCLPTENYREEL